MKRFIINIVLVLLPICLIVVLVNFFEDPAHLYGNRDYEEQLARMIVVSKKNVTNVDKDFSIRIFKKKLCENYIVSDSIDVLVLGSSRVHQISTRNFRGKKLLNMGVSGATIEDECALMYTCVLSGLKPSLVLLGIDPFYFNANCVNERTKELRKQYDEYLTEIGQNKTRSQVVFDWEKWGNLLSFSYFQQGIKYFGVGNKEMTVTDRFENKLDTWHYDGSITYGEEVRKRSVEEVNEIAGSFTYYQWNKFNEISLEKAESLIELIDYIKSQNADILIFLPPYHPVTYDRFMCQREFQQITNAELLMEKIVREENLEVVGNWNPKKCGCDETDFFDAVHLNAKGLDKIFGE